METEEEGQETESHEKRKKSWLRRGAGPGQRRGPEAKDASCSPTLSYATRVVSAAKKPKLRVCLNHFGF